MTWRSARAGRWPRTARPATRVAILTLSRGARRRDQEPAGPRVAGGRRHHRRPAVPATTWRTPASPRATRRSAIIEEVVAELQPTIVYTHSVHDLHQDHRNVHRAAMVACRRVGRVYCFQSPSATVDYRPTHFVTVDDYVGRKLKVIDAFGSQAGIRDYLEPELITATARYWARYCDGTLRRALRDGQGPRRGPAPRAAAEPAGSAVYDGAGHRPGAARPARRAGCRVLVTGAGRPRGDRRDEVAAGRPRGRAARRGHGPVGGRPLPGPAAGAHAGPGGGRPGLHRTSLLARCRALGVRRRAADRRRGAAAAGPRPRGVRGARHRPAARARGGA